MAIQSTQNLYDTTIRLLRHGALSNVKKVLAKLHPADIASLIDKLDEPYRDQMIDLLLDHPQLHQIISELGSDFLAEYINRYQNFTHIVEILQRLPSDERADLISGLPEDLREQILSRMKEEQSAEIEGLLQYQDSMAGRIMSTEVFKLPENTTIQEAVQCLQQATSHMPIYYIYIVDDFDHLNGVLSMRQLFHADSQVKLKEIMLRDVVRVSTEESQEEVARLVAQYDIVAIPVVDPQGKLVGVITVDDVIDVIREEANEKALQLGDAEADALYGIDPWHVFLHRIPWFLILFVGGIFTAEVIDYFYRSLPTVGVFAAFIPLILRFGGVIAKQTSTLVITGSSVESVGSEEVLKIFFQQAKTTLGITLIIGVLVAIYAYFRFPAFPLFSVVISMALFSSMIIALLLGLIIPLGFKKLKLDPAWATGSLINFILDVLQLVIYFRVLIWML